MNIIVPMIVMLGCLEIDMEVLDVDMETAGSDNYREVLEDNGDTNSVLVIIQERARFSYKDRWKFINIFTQSINRLCQTSQLYPRTKEQEELSAVT